MNYCESCKLFGGHRAIPKGSKSPELYVLSDLVLNFDDTASGGEYLGMSLRSAGFNTDNMRYFSIVRCNIENATNKELDEYRTKCINYAKEDIIKKNPSLVLLVGGSVSKIILGDEFKKISSSRGRIYSVDINGISIKVMPIYSPKFVLNNTYFQKDFMDDIAKARSYIDGKLIDISDKVMLSATTYDEFKDFYDKYLVNSKSPAFDLETNAEEPHSNKIKIIGFSFGADDGIHGIYVVKNSLEYQMPDEDYDKIVQLSKQILESKVIRVHNIKYELPVTYNCWGTLVAKDVPDFDDSLIKARMILGGKTGAGLKPRCQSELGYPDWETDLNDYRSAFTGLIAGYHKTAAGKERWDYEKFIKLPDMYSVSEMYSSYEDKDLDKRSTNNKNCVNSLINIVEDYYDEDESKYILGLIKEKITDLIYIDYTGPFSYAFLPKKIIEKYGAIDSIGCIDLNNHYDQKIKEFSKKLNIDLPKGYIYFKEHYLLSAWMEINGIHWNNEIAEDLYKWYNEKCIECTKEMLSNPHVIDYIFENQRGVYNTYLIENHLDEVERVLGKISSIQKYNIVFEKDNRKVSKKNILYEMGEDYINTHKDDIVNYAMSLTKDYKDYRDYKWLFNPASPSLNKLLAKIMVSDEIKVAKMYFMMEHLTEDPNFNLSNYDTGSARLFKIILDAHEYYSYMKSDDEDKKISEYNYFRDKIYKKISKKEVLEFFLETLNSNTIQSREIMDIAREALTYTISSCDEPTMIDLSNYFLLAGVDFDDKSTWSESYHFLFYFRLWKKCNKMVCSYLDGEKVGRGVVYQVDKAGLQSGEYLTRREKKYFDKDTNIHLPDKDFVMQQDFNTCGVQSYRWSGGIHTLPTGADIKNIFTPRFKYGTFFSPDASQAEIRYLAGISGCKSLLDAFRNGADIHTTVACAVFNKPEVTSAERRFCLRGNTSIKLINGTIRTIKELADSNSRDFWVYSWDISRNMMVPGLAKLAKKTVSTNLIYRITLDNGKFVECTDNHRFLMLDNSYVEAKSLKIGDRVKPLYYEITDNKDNLVQSSNNNKVNYLSEGYEIFVDSDGQWFPTHRRVTDVIYPDISFKCMTRHHKDFNKLNNDPDNLLLLTWSDHMKLHCELGDHNFKVLNPELLDYNNPKYAKSRKLNAKKISNSLREKHKTDDQYHQQELEILSNARRIRWNREGESERFSKYYSKHMYDRWANNPEYREYKSREARKVFTNTRINKCLEVCDKCIEVYGEFTRENYTELRSSDKYKCSTFIYDKLIEKVGSEELLFQYIKTGYRLPTTNLEVYKNHKVINIEKIVVDNEDMYDIEVDKYDNFLVDLGDKSGVFVHNSKMSTFSIIYGATPESFANNYLHGDIARGRAIYEGFYSAYPEVKDFMAEKHAEMKKYGMVANKLTPLFMYCNPEMYGNNENQAKRISANSVIQSGSSMLVGITGYQIMKYIIDHNLRSKLVCFIHDSIESEIAPEELIEISAVVVPMMNNFPDEEFGIPMKTHLILGPSFGQEIEFDKFECNDDYTECTMEGEGLKQDIDQWVNSIRDFYDIFELEVLEAKEKYISWNNLYLPKHAISQNYGTNIVEERIRVHIKMDPSKKRSTE